MLKRVTRSLFPRIRSALVPPFRLRHWAPPSANWRKTGGGACGEGGWDPATPNQPALPLLVPSRMTPRGPHVRFADNACVGAAGSTLANKKLRSGNAETRRPRYVGLSSDSDRKADIAGLLKRATNRHQRPHSITSSASASNFAGTSRPSAFAVLMVDHEFELG